MSNILKSYFIYYGGFLLYLEVEREVPTEHVGNRVLWLIVLFYDISISVLMAIDQNETGTVFYLTIIHAVKVMCNLLIVIVENCLGVSENSHLEQDLEERILAKNDEEDMSYLDIMTSQVPNNPVNSSKGREIRAKRNKSFLDIRRREPSIRENRANSQEIRKKNQSLAAQLQELAFNHQESSESLDFVVDGKVESIRSKEGDRIDYFTIEVYLGTTFLTKVKRNLIQIRTFDNEVRHNINYEMPNLSDLSKTFLPDILDDLQIHDFLEEYFKAAVSKGIDYPVIINFFELYRISDQLRTLSLSDIELGYHADDCSSLILPVPEGISHVYTPKLVKLYHEKSTLFEINLLPISEAMLEEVQKKTNIVRQTQISLRKKIKEKGGNAASKGIAKKRKELKEVSQDLMNFLLEGSGFTSESLTSEGISTGNFEKDPEAYMDYHKLTVSTEIKEWIKASSPVLMIFASSKINDSLRFTIVRQVKEFLIFHFINNLKEQGLKMPNRSGEGFIVRLLIYLQTLLEDKDLQSYDGYSLVGVDQSLFHLLYSIDTGVVLTGVQTHLQTLDADPRSATFSLLIHVSFGQ